MKKNEKSEQKEDKQKQAGNVNIPEIKNSESILEQTSTQVDEQSYNITPRIYADQLYNTRIFANPQTLYSDIVNPDYARVINSLDINRGDINSRLFSNGNYRLDSTLDNQFQLAEEITELKRKLKKSGEELKDTKADRENKIAEFEKIRNELIAKEQINHILTRISEDGRKKLLESEPFRNLFKNSTKCEAIVVSIDIRRSTELMLKARTPELFSKFITQLSSKLSQVIISNFGIFDKFTGDGILAFFPKFYSGKEAVIRAIKAANDCHLVFSEHYNASRDCFNVFIKDVGLGIGIDYGIVTLVNTQSELTVVGIPVVYACRFSGAKAGETLVNQPAKEEVLRLTPHQAAFVESEINIKNEGAALGYRVSLNESAFNLENPNWDELIEEHGTKE